MIAATLRKDGSDFDSMTEKYLHWRPDRDFCANNREVKPAAFAKK
jgi:hypothetical protein